MAIPLLALVSGLEKCRATDEGTWILLCHIDAGEVLHILNQETDLERPDGSRWSVHQAYDVHHLAFAGDVIGERSTLNEPNRSFEPIEHKYTSCRTSKG